MKNKDYNRSMIRNNGSSIGMYIRNTADITPYCKYICSIADINKLDEMLRSLNINICLQS